MMETPVLIVGAGVAGATAGLLFARRGIPALVVDRKPDASDYKRLCTHFIQPAALPVIRKLGLEQDFRAIGVPTRAAFWSGDLWVDPPGDYGIESQDGKAEVAWNFERRLLDPFLLRRLRTAPTCSVRLDWQFVDATRSPGGGWSVSLNCRGKTHTVETRLLIGADGRQSSVAKALEMPLTFRAPNERACRFAYFEDCGPIPEDRSLFMHDGDSMAFLYPEGRGRVLLCAFTPKEHAIQKLPASGMAAGLLDMFQRLPHGVDISRARVVSAVSGYRDYPNQRRLPIVPGAALLGDAAISLDPMSGVGCAFAMIGADMLVDAVSCVLLEGGNLGLALDEYVRALDLRIGPHVKGICADTRIAKSQSAVRSNFRLIASDPVLQRLFLALTGRLQTPADFQRAFLQTISRQAVQARESVSDHIG